MDNQNFEDFFKKEPATSPELIERRKEFRKKLENPEFLPSVCEIQDLFPNPNSVNGQMERLNLCEYGGHKIFEFITSELVDGLASHITKLAGNYVRNKNMPLVVLEVGAGNGKLSHHLQKSLESKGWGGKINVIATDNGQNGIKPYYPVAMADSATAANKYNPDIIIMSWMPVNTDFTADWRKCGNLKEYILIGECGESACGHPVKTWGEAPRDWRGVDSEYIPDYKRDGFEREFVNIKTEGRSPHSLVNIFRKKN